MAAPGWAASSAATWSMLAGGISGASPWQFTTTASSGQPRSVGDFRRPLGPGPMAGSGHHAPRPRNCAAGGGDPLVIGGNRPPRRQHSAAPGARRAPARSTGQQRQRLAGKARRRKARRDHHVKPVVTHRIVPSCLKPRKRSRTRAPTAGWHAQFRAGDPHRAAAVTGRVLYGVLLRHDDRHAAVPAERLPGRRARGRAPGSGCTRSPAAASWA